MHKLDGKAATRMSGNDKALLHRVVTWAPSSSTTPDNNTGINIDKIHTSISVKYTHQYQHVKHVNMEIIQDKYHELHKSVMPSHE